MAVVTPDTFLDNYPDFCGFSRDRVRRVLAVAERQHPANVWAADGDTTVQEDVIMLHAAHTLDMQRQQMAASAATAVNVAAGQGGGSSGGGSPDLEQTTYGRQLLDHYNTNPLLLGFAL